MFFENIIKKFEIFQKFSHYFVKFETNILKHNTFYGKFKNIFQAALFLRGLSQKFCILHTKTED